MYPLRAYKTALILYPNQICTPTALVKASHYQSSPLPKKRKHGDWNRRDRGTQKPTTLRLSSQRRCFSPEAFSSPTQDLLTRSPRGLDRRLHVLHISFLRGSYGSIPRSQEKALFPVRLPGFHRYTARSSLSSVKQRQDGEAIDDQDHQPVAGAERADRANQHPVKGET
jgi:hypothetical protein